MNIPRITDTSLELIKKYTINIKRYSEHNYLNSAFNNSFHKNLLRLGNIEDVYVIITNIWELFKNSYEHSTSSETVTIELFNSDEMIFTSYFEDKTTFYNSKEIKESLESRKRIPTRKIKRPKGYGTQRITLEPDFIHLDIIQEKIFLGYKKPKQNC